jgi:hypothetical protein
MNWLHGAASLIKAEENLRKGGIVLWLTARNTEACNAVKRSPPGKALGTERMFLRPSRGS